MTLVSDRIAVSNEQIAEFCQQWRIVELALFGSVLRDDFGSESDVDVLVTFAPSARWSQFMWRDEASEGRPPMVPPLRRGTWIPACAGMTGSGLPFSVAR